MALLLQSISPNTLLYSILVLMLITAAGFLLLLFLIAGEAKAQQPNCSKAEFRATLAESRLDARQVEVNTLAARLEQAQRELARQKGQTSEAEQRAGSANRNAVSLAESVSSLSSENQSAKQKIVELEKALAASQKENVVHVGERDAALLRIKKANGRFLCEVFHVGCIGAR